MTMFQFVVLYDGMRMLAVIGKNHVWRGMVSNFFEALYHYLPAFGMDYVCSPHSFCVAIKNKNMNQN